MRSRWFHRPAIHAPPEGHGKRVSWLELFYDLIFVAAVIQLGDYLSDDVSFAGFMKFSGHFVPLWVAWSGFTFYANRYNVDDFLHRTLVLLKMAAVGTMAIASHQAMNGDPTVFALGFSVAQAIIALLHLRAWIQDPVSRRYSAYWGAVFTLGSAAFALSVLLPMPWCYGLWAIGIGAILFAPAGRRSRELAETFPLDMEHLSERYGLLTIIVLGESFVKVLSYLTSTGHGAEMEYLLLGFFNLALTCALWWIYFDDVAGSKLKEHRASWLVWLYAHLPLTLAITGVGVAVKKALSFEMSAVAPDNYRWLLAGTLALSLLSVAMIDSITERRNNELSDRNRVMARLFSAAILLLLGQVGGSMPAAVFLGLVAAICNAQVLFDMMMAPFEDGEIAGFTPSTELAQQRADHGDARVTRRVVLGQVVRKGAPSELRRDLYFFFIEGSWTRLLLSFGFLYVFLNVLFAALYQLEPGSIKGDTNQGFADAFYFSVQTLASLGYGAITPATTWANTLVTVETAVGMLFAALATGLMFAKASRPRALVMFSKHPVVTVRNGKPTLMVRLANARGTEVVDASLDITVLLDEISPEGHHMRRIHDLKLERNRSPMFVLTWLALHVIDESSPMYGVDWSQVVGMVVTLVGHDGTYGQTTYARKIYSHEDIRFNHRFVDVIGELPDGRLMIDLTVFHDTVPDVDAPHPDDALSGTTDPVASGA